ncbi:hypothetical protein [Virgibacillus sp. DJP39]|uniref:hypothetical protein n=1 Tax=Virgibacillus sp. DJP39 TaxID=3409790 RepID=UPI003BB7CA18
MRKLEVITEELLKCLKEIGFPKSRFLVDTFKKDIDKIDDSKKEQVVKGFEFWLEDIKEIDDEFKNQIGKRYVASDEEMVINLSSVINYN